MAPAAKILLVDDHEQNLTLLRVILRPHGYDIRLSHSGEEALRQVSTDPPDLIILDIMMPGQNGYQIFSSLRNDAHTLGIPVIIMTARAEHIYERISVDLGAANHITKPFHPLDLVEKVKVLLPIP